MSDTGINFQDMVPDEPDQVGKVRDSGFVDNEPQHGLVLHFVHIESQGPHGDSHHRLTVVEELDGFRIQREIVGVLQRNQNLLIKNLIGCIQNSRFPKNVGNFMKAPESVFCAARKFTRDLSIIIL